MFVEETRRRPERPSRIAPDRPGDRLPGVFRFAVELLAWVAVPWALAGVSIPLAVLSVVVLVGLPTVFSTPGDKNQVLVPVPGVVSIALVLLHLVAAAWAAWAAWPATVAIAVTVLAAACLVTERARWRWLLGR
jgi:hypothetical protein